MMMCKIQASMYIVFAKIATRSSTCNLEFVAMIVLEATLLAIL